MKTWPFKVVNEGGKPIIEVDYRNETKRFKPEEISSMVSSITALDTQTSCSLKPPPQQSSRR